MTEENELQWQEDAPYSPVYDDIYFSPADGLAETQYVFIEQTGLVEYIHTHDCCVVGETGFGTGLNFFATWQAWKQRHQVAHSAPPTSPTAVTEQRQPRLHYFSIEKYPVHADDIRRAHQACVAAHADGAEEHLSQASVEEFLAVYPIRRRGQHLMQLDGGQVHVHLIFDDILPALQTMQAHCDIWYLDGFAPAKNPEMWTESVCKEIARHSHQGTRLSTFTAVGFVRRQLQACGFAMEKYAGFGKKRHMLRGVFQGAAQSLIDEPWFAPSVAVATGSQRAASQVVIIGAGLAGSALADRCAQGGMQVSLYDGAGVAGAASGNHAGMYQPSLAADDSPYAQYYFSAWQLFRQRLQQLSVRGFDGWKPCGVAHILRSERDKKRAQKIIAGSATQDAWLRHIAATAHAECRDTIGIDIPHDILHIKDGGIVSPLELCQMYAAHERIHVAQHNIQRIEYRDGMWHVFDAADRCVERAPVCVIAAAYATMEFPQCRGLQMQGVRGQLCLQAATTTSQALIPALSGGVYMTPLWKDTHVIGATFQRDDYDLTLRQEDQDGLIADAQQMWQGVPVPAAGVLRGRCALRASGPDRMPIVGQMIDAASYEAAYAGIKHGRIHRSFPLAEYQPGLYVNTAHGARGIVGTCLAAEMLYAMIQGYPAVVATPLYKALHTGRFLIKSLQRA